ncbi:hypothetical protein K8T06_08075 [bacterium]|nr:hypothetical protein [bacterium]
MLLRHIQALLEHESLNSTQIYTHVAVADLREVLLKYHPREIDSCRGFLQLRQTDDVMGRLSSECLNCSYLVCI